MALHRDFLMRQIEQFAAAFFRIANGKAVEAPEQALFEIEELLGEALGTSREFALGLGASAIDNLEPAVAAELGRLLLLHTKLSTDLGQHDRAKRAGDMGFRAVEIALGRPATEYGALAEEVLREHLERAAATIGSERIAQACMAAHEVAFINKRFDDAEDWLFFALDAASSPVHLEQGRLFYERLSALSAAHLEAGGLSVDEVAESLAALAERSE